MLYANYDFTLVAVLVAVVFSAVSLITIRHARKAHGSLSAAFRNLVQTMHSVLRDDGEIRFRTLAEALPQIVWTASPGSGVDYCNCRWYQLTGFTEAQTLGWGWPNALHPDDRPVALENWEKCRHTGESFEMEYRLLNAAGGFRWHLVRATPMRDSDGVIVKWFGACADIDDQIRNQQLLEEQIRQHTAALMEANTLLQSEMRERALAQQELNLQNERMVRELTKRSNRATNLAKMAELLQSCSEVTDAFSVVAGMAPKVFPELRGALHLFNSSRERLEVAAIWEDCTLPDNAFGAQDCWALRTGHMHVVVSGDHSAECVHAVHADHSYVCLPLLAHGEAIGILHFQMIEPGEVPQPVLLMVTMFTEQVGLSVANIRLREALRNQSIRDPLTALYNRRYLEEMLQRETRRAVRAEQGLGVIMLDLDHFKKFNDTFGHEAGDTVLRETAAFLLKERSRRGHCVSLRGRRIPRHPSRRRFESHTGPRRAHPIQTARLEGYASGPSRSEWSQSRWAWPSYPCTARCPRS